ncbi:PAS domain-containing protein [Alphaproteobacteria bacterium GH1-50]|uniref:PAS domain-containing protein n=1 Tax=Kangsaoukella pontilimi TaxID=2691042 RepID=A0A7C9IP11_9RHOB|nr:PAS domain-containing protein [Kangsaoukella pontilimi]MXQ06563.1 PAS domain-containing protein [Kangsaoukella pontilimi]
MTDTLKDSDIADLVAKSVAPTGHDAVRQLFNDAGARAPEVIWSPGTADVRNPLLRQFQAIVKGYKVDGRVPAKSLRLEDFGGLTEWLMLLQPVEDGADFEYLAYGSSITDSFGMDMTGHRTSEFGGYISTFFLGLYRAVLAQKACVYSEHEPPRNVFVRVWQRLIVPLFDEAGEVARILVLNVPDNELRAGLELMVDPVFVLRGDESVIYANRAAQSIFRFTQRDAIGQSLEAATGVPLELGWAPEDMLSQHKIDDSVRLTIRDGIVERLVMTVSATQHRDEAFYVVVMRLIGT